MSDKPAVDYRGLLKDAYVSLEKLKARVQTLETEKTVPIAVVGMGCRFPGTGSDIGRFWNMLDAGESAISEVPGDRWNIDEYYDPNPDAPGKIYSRWGGFVPAIDRFEPQFFGISPREAVSMDPQQRLLLEVAWEALEDAAQDPTRLAGAAAGVFVGISFSEYGTLLNTTASPAQRDLYSATGNALSIAAGRLSYALGLHGPAMAVDTACSSSLVSVHLAIQSLRNRECNLALAGGVSLILTPDGSIVTCRGRMLSFDGQCKTFDASADGYVRGEGCGIVVLKRLKDALKDRDRVLAVLLGSAVNQDGRSSGLTAPNGAAQEALLTSALRNAGVQPGSVSYIEAHGTGTPLGDPIEMRAINAVFGQNRDAATPLRVGSVKTNIGHLESAAGVAGLIKVVASLQHRRIPAHLNLTTPSPRIPWAEMPIEIPKMSAAWTQAVGARTAGVSAFGFSGTNAHVVVQEWQGLEQHVEHVERVETAGPDDRPCRLLTLSARTDGSLRNLAGRFERHLGASAPEGFADICFTANSGRARLDRRLSIVSGSVDEARRQLEAFAGGNRAPGLACGVIQGSDTPKIAFLFTGQGSQYPDMGRQLFDLHPVFREAMQECDELLGEIDGRRLLSVVYPAERGATADALLPQTGYAQPALFALEYALARLWRSWGVVPGAVLGHSVGEYAAACVAGVFSLADGLRLIEARGRLMQGLPAGGAMLAVSAGAAVISDALSQYPGVAIAAFNAPREVVLSGDAMELGRVEQVLASAGVQSTRLHVSHAFHSSLMAPMVDAFAQTARSVAYGRPALRIVSNLTARPASDTEPMDAEYWCRHVLAPVRFGESLEAVRAQGYDLCVEIGPQPVLVGLGRRAQGDGDAAGAWLPSLRRGRPDWQQMMETLGELFVRGVAFDAEAVERPFSRRKVSLPTYPFERERYWIAPEGAARPGQTGKRITPGGLRGLRVRSPLTSDAVFQTEISTESVPFVADHVVYGNVLFPAAGLLEMALSTSAAAFEACDRRIEAFEIREALLLQEGESRTVQTVLSQPREGVSHFTIYSASDGGDWTVHASGDVRLEGVLTPAGMPRTPDQVRDRCTATETGDAFYSRLRESGIEYGPTFRRIEQIWTGRDEALGRIVATPAEPGVFTVHPGLLDSCFQMLGAACTGRSTGSDELFLPVGIQSVRVMAEAGSGPMWAYASLREPASGHEETITADFWWEDESGQPVAHIEGLTAKRARKSLLQRGGRHDLDRWMHEIDWQLVGGDDALSSPAVPRRWIVLSDGSEPATELAARLRARGEGCALVVPGREFDRLGDEIYVVDPASRESLDRMLRRLMPEPGTPCGIVHVSCAPAGEQGPGLSQDANLVEGLCGSLLALTQALSGLSAADVRLWTVTTGAQPVEPGQVVNPSQTALWGLTQVLAAEHPSWRPVRIDLDPATTVDQIDLLVRELQGSADEDQVAFRGERRFVARLVNRGDGRGRPRLAIPQEECWQLAIPKRGTIENLQFERCERRRPEAGEIEVRVDATGLNFRDVLNVLGMYPGDPGPLGSECSGQIVAVGDGVTGVKPGDDVICMGGGTFKPYFTVSAGMVLRKPQQLTHEQAAGLPIAYLTALYGLKYLGEMKRGDRVLIHAAAGGVGMAAVQLALRAGAEVFGTAGSTAKRRLLEEMGVHHVLSSRTLDFAGEIAALTDGRGVDIVLNSLTGEFITRSLSLLAPGGRFVELGKADLWDPARVAAVNPHVRYDAFDLGEVLVSDRALAERMYAELLEGLADETLRPLPVRVFDIDEAPAAFRFMAQARHVGKVVVGHRVAGRRGVSNAAAFRADASYLITGGLGALGLSVAAWMVERGARHLVLAGRSAPSDSACAEIAALQTAGADVRVVAADVTSESDVRQMVSAATESGHPLRGVVHAAGLVRDRLLEQQTWEEAARVLAPKVTGTQLLDRLTRECALDHFILFSSVASLMGGPGQGAYAAGNAFLDAVAHQRRAAGFAAQSLNWGPWADRGMAAAMSDRERERMTASGLGMISTADGLACLDRVINTGATQIAIMPVHWEQVCRRFEKVPPLLRAVAARALAGAVAGAGHDSASTPAPTAQELAGISASERRAVLSSYLMRQVARVLQIGVEGLDTGRSLLSMGLDSLMAVELKGRLEADLHVSVPMTQMLGGPSVDHLAEFVTALMLSSLQGDRSDATPPGVLQGGTRDEQEASLDADDLAALSDADVDAALQALLGQPSGKT